MLFRIHVILRIHHIIDRCPVFHTISLCLTYTICPSCTDIHGINVISRITTSPMCPITFCFSEPIKISYVPVVLVVSQLVSVIFFLAKLLCISCVPVVPVMYSFIGIVSRFTMVMFHFISIMSHSIPVVSWFTCHFTSHFYPSCVPVWHYDIR